MNLSELKTAHTAAGAAYQSAIEQLRAAFIQLAALDRVLEGVGDVFPIPSFNHLPQNAEGFCHPIFSPLDPTSHWRDQVYARRDELNRAFQK